MNFANRLGRRLLVCSLLAAAASGAGAAVTFIVDDPLDRIDDDLGDGVCHTVANTCALRAAVMQANVVTGAGTTILLPAGLYGLTRPATGQEVPADGNLNFTAPASGNPPIWIVGAGPSSTIIDANQIDNVLTVASGRTATLTGLTLRNGYESFTTGSGGGLENSGNLTIENCTISDSQTALGGRWGGGVYNSSTGALQLIDSTVTRNLAQWSGGGIYNRGNLVVERSTIQGNRTHVSGGGVANDAGSMSVTNSTIVANDADYDGGGIQHVGGGSTALYSVTVFGNGADYDADVNGGIGGGVFASAGTFLLANSLVANNTLFNQPVYDDCYGTLVSYRSNLFGEISAGCTIQYGGGDGWTTLSSLDHFSALGGNGGPTATLSLLPGNEAIDAGDSTLGCTDPSGASLANDQRGAGRVRGLRCDVGAFESGTLFFDGFESSDTSAW